ncbi:hypothetical protein MASR1M32_05580 [Rhodobacter sp.]
MFSPNGRTIPVAGDATRSSTAGGSTRAFRAPDAALAMSWLHDNPTGGVHDIDGGFFPAA